MKRYNFSGLERINKTNARKIYENGDDILFVPCNIRPDNMFGLGIWENKELWGQYDSFNKLCEWYEVYNCNSYNGRYIAFYIKK
jgi:hypothetical protein